VAAVDGFGRPHSASGLEQVVALSRSGSGRLLLVLAGFFCWYGGIAAVIRGAADGGSLLFVGTFLFAIAAWGRWRERRREARRRRSSWAAMIALTVVGLVAAVFAIFLLARRGKAPDELPPLAADEVDELARAELQS